MDGLNYEIVDELNSEENLRENAGLIGELNRKLALDPEAKKAYERHFRHPLDQEEYAEGIFPYKGAWYVVKNGSVREHYDPEVYGPFTAEQLIAAIRQMRFLDEEEPALFRDVSEYFAFPLFGQALPPRHEEPVHTPVTAPAEAPRETVPAEESWGTDLPERPWETPPARPEELRVTRREDPATKRGVEWSFLPRGEEDAPVRLFRERDGWRLCFAEMGEARVFRSEKACFRALFGGFSVRFGIRREAGVFRDRQKMNRRKKEAERSRRMGSDAVLRLSSPPIAREEDVIRSDGTIRLLFAEANRRLDLTRFPDGWSIRVGTAGQPSGWRRLAESLSDGACFRCLFETEAWLQFPAEPAGLRYGEYGGGSADSALSEGFRDYLSERNRKDRG